MELACVAFVYTYTAVHRTFVETVRHVFQFKSQNRTDLLPRRLNVSGENPRLTAPQNRLPRLVDVVYGESRTNYTRQSPLRVVFP